MIGNNSKRINEFDDPFRDVHFPFDPDYQVDLKDCENPIEEYNECIAAMVAQKYNLVYHQGEAISTRTLELSEELTKAREEIGKYMPVGKIRRWGPPANEYYFVFNSLGVEL